MSWRLHDSTIAGGVAGVVSSVVTCPLDVVKTKLQAQGRINAALGRHGVIGTIRRIAREEGLRGFYRGLGPTIFGYLPTWAIYFTVYDEVKAVLGRRRGKEAEMDWTTHIMASSMAGATGTIITNPLWVVKTRFMTQDDSLPRYQHTLHALQQIYRTEGVRAFYKGLLPSLIGVTHVCVQFPLYEHLKLRLRPEDGSDLPTSRILLCSSISKMVASMTTYPHEVVRTRLQIARYHPASRSSPAHPSPSSPISPFTAQRAVSPGTKGGSRIVEIVRTIVREEGLKGLYKGLSVNLLRTVPNSAMTLLTYELIMSKLTHRRTDHRPESKSESE